MSTSVQTGTIRAFAQRVEVNTGAYKTKEACKFCHPSYPSCHTTLQSVINNDTSESPRRKQGKFSALVSAVSGFVGISHYFGVKRNLKERLAQSLEMEKLTKDPKYIASKSISSRAKQLFSELIQHKKELEQKQLSNLNLNALGLVSFLAGGLLLAGAAYLKVPSSSIAQRITLLSAPVLAFGFYCNSSRLESSRVRKQGVVLEAARNFLEETEPFTKRCLNKVVDVVYAVKHLILWIFPSKSDD